MDYHRPDQQTLASLKHLGDNIRIGSIEGTTASSSGHPTSCASAADIIAVLFGHVMKYKLEEPRDASSDRFVLSKGHAAPALYAAWAEVGLFDPSELKNLRKLKSDLEGHPTPRLPFIDVATGSLGQGLSTAVGMAYTGKYFDKASYRVYCLLGDGESAEGSVWEAMAFASHYRLDNIVAIFDVNRLGQSQATQLGHDMDAYKNRCEAFGFHTYVVDGHDIDALCKAFHDASTVKGKPSAILARTFKGAGLSGFSDMENWHGKPLAADVAREVIAKLRSGHPSTPHGMRPHPPPCDAAPVPDGPVTLPGPPTYELGQAVATRQAYGNALLRLGQNCPRVIALDGDMKNSTFSLKFRDAFPDRFIECFIAEQNLVGVGIGCATRDRTIPFASTFACFLTRAFDQIRMGAVSQTNLNFCGSHAGVSIGEDGPSQMALEDLAMFRTVPGSTVFYPSDAVSCERAVELAANTKGVCFIRTTRPNTAVTYANEEPFAIGKGKLVRSSGDDKATVVGAGVTLFEALKAADILAGQGIGIRVVDPFTVKPIDAQLLKECAQATGGHIITVEDHYPEGGLGEAVAGAMCEEANILVHRLSVKTIPRSGKPAELLALYEIDAAAIVAKVKSLLGCA